MRTCDPAGTPDLRILIVESSRSNGGTEQHGVTLATALQQRGQQLHVIARQGTWFADAARQCGLPVTEVQFRGGADPRLVAVLIRRLIMNRPDWLMTNDSKLYWPLIVLARVFGVRVALFRHLIALKRTVTRRWAPVLADRFFVMSEYARASLVARGSKPEAIRVLANPIDTSKFRPSPRARERSRRAMGISDSDIAIGFVGRFLQSKGILFLAAALREAMEANPAIRMVWIGDGPDKAILRDATSGAFAPRHRFLGWREDLPDLLQALDLVAVPSLAAETFGRVSAEAQACELPVLCSDAGGLADTLLPGVTGLLLPAGDVLAWRDAITMLASDGDARRRMGVHGREHVVASFSLEQVCARLEAELTDGTSPGTKVATKWDLRRH